jgi:hypothetical protein
MNTKRYSATLNRQSGLAGWVMVALLTLIYAAALVGFTSYAARSERLTRDKRSQQALAQAKEALLGFAVGNPDRGYLPCPADPALAGTATEGTMLATCATASTRIGRLPWKSLGIEELTDGYGVPLWYAVSTNFTNDATTINSVSVGTLSINGTGTYAAIVFSAAEPLPGQSRTATVATCATTGTLLREDYCPANYLDVDSVSAISNADADATFVQTKGISFNDQLLSLAPQQFFTQVGNRVLRQVKACLTTYAAAAGGNFPWAHPVALGQPDPSDKALSYADQNNQTIGRISDAPINSVGVTSVTWTADCPLPACATPGACTATKNWSRDWRELVFYAVDPASAPGGSGVSSGALTVGTTPNVRAAVLLAGPVLAAEVRILANDLNTPSNYLEGNELATYALSPVIWDQGPVTATFNDTTLVVAP